MTEVEELVRTEFECTYKYSTNLRDVWAGDGTDSMMVRCTFISIQ